MNDTILNSRQRQILKLLKDKSNLSRLGISRLLISPKIASKVTVIRDLKHLVKSGFVSASGKGRAIRYGLVAINPLLEYVDMPHYFETDSELRQIKSKFNQSIYVNLSNLYSQDEIDLWEKSSQVFKQAGEKLDASIYKRELERFVIELAWKSSQIEGNTYTLIETETLIKQNVRARGHPEEEAVMILNHKDAFDMILDRKASFKKLDLADIVQLHNVLTKGLVTSGIRSQPVGITGTAYRPPSGKHELETALRQLIKHVNGMKYPPEKALTLAAMIAYLQPFADGNKRTARILANAVLIAHDYFPLSYRNVDVNEYRSAMIIFYETNNLYNFKRIFINQLEFAVKSYFTSN